MVGKSACPDGNGPTPHGVGGLKYDAAYEANNALASHPTRGGWIEMSRFDKHSPNGKRPTPHGVGGLKLQRDSRYICTLRPTPHGVGGLKSFLLHDICVMPSVPPHTGWVD